MRPTNSVRLNLEELSLRINPGTLTFYNGYATYTAGTGETNVVSVSGNSSSVTISDTAGITLDLDWYTLQYTTVNGNSVTINLGHSGVEVFAGDMGDTLDASSYSAGNTVEMWGDAGADSIVGSPGTDNLYGGTGSDSIVAGNGNDNVFGDADNDTIYDGTGDDSVLAGEGDDSICICVSV